VLIFALHLTIGGLGPEVRRAYLTTRIVAGNPYIAASDVLHVFGGVAVAKQEKSI